MADDAPRSSRPNHDGRTRRVVRHYTDLEVWRVGMDVTDAVCQASAGFPKAEAFGLTSQIRRAAVSVPSNIAECWGRGRTGKYVQFLRYARGSFYEIETQLRIAQRRGYINDQTLQTVLQQTASVGRMPVGLTRSLK